MQRAMPGFTSYHFKLIAAFTMLLDHIAAILYPEADWLRAIGRISFPAFLYLLVQGEVFTKDVGRYGLRLGLLAIISQPIYQIAFDTNQLNVLFLLLIGLICLRQSRRYQQLSFLIWLAGALMAELLNTSYGGYGILLILLIRAFRPTLLWWSGWLGFNLTWMALIGGWFQLPILWVPLLFMSANGQRGAKARWFYGFYPGHLLLLAMIAGALR